ncbi:hypothetical protein [Corynebacterium poyangense]|nr:hypothetical protein [Corynebacterium poyangense]
MVLEIAAAWPCDPLTLLEADDIIIATMIDILEERAREMKK